MALAALAACGPSAAEIKTAKSAGYSGDPGEMFDIIEATTAQTYKIGEVVREGELALATVPQWYNPEGGRQSSGAGDYVQVSDRSIQLSMIVRLVDADRRFVVTVEPKTFQHISGSPQPRELRPDDPNLPGWVSGRVDSLHLEIHKALQKYAVQ
jgi:hypothetical protein